MNNYEFDDEENSESIVWLAFWCNEGLECIISVSDFMTESKIQLAEILKTGNSQGTTPEEKLSSAVFAMKMRARMNSQRDYELYTFNSNAGITKENLEEWFEHLPQEAVNWVRENGNGILKKSGKTKPLIN